MTKSEKIIYIERRDISVSLPFHVFKSKDKILGYLSMSPSRYTKIDRVEYLELFSMKIKILLENSRITFHLQRVNI